MSRQLGIIPLDHNTECHMARPLDARARVKHLSDLTSEESWIEEGGVSVAYSGMLVVVYKDHDEENNGVYRLKHRNFRLQENWVKVEGSGGPAVDAEITQDIWNL